MVQGVSKGTALLEVRGLSKMFGSFTACDQISLSIAPGEIHSLLGENGAGKSTLVKMLFGVLQPTGGEIFWHGKPVVMGSPGQARRTGVGMVFQHFSLFEALTVAENVALSFETDMPISRIAKETKRLSEDYGLPLDPYAHIADLSVGERQRVEIVRTLLQKPELIILDEPTSVLTPQEADRLFVLLEQLRDEGKAVLYISHRLEEVRRLCDSATVLRQGKVTGSCNPREQTAASLAQMMVGAEIKQLSRHGLQAKSEILLETHNLNLPAKTPFATALKDINIRLHAGEILAIAGVAGNGQNELFDSLSGETLAADMDAIHMNGKPVGQLNITQRRRLDASFVPEERNGHAMVGIFPLSENVILARHSPDAKTYLKGGFLKILQRATVAGAAKRICSDMDVRKSGDDPAAASLSGGNLQKFSVGRELDRNPKILIVNQPTWGVDAGAATHIRQALVELAREGAAVLVISQDLDEVFEIATHVSVIHRGELSEPEPIEKMTRERIGLLMMGHGEAAKETAHVL